MGRLVKVFPVRLRPLGEEHVSTQLVLPYLLTTDANVAQVSKAVKSD